MTHRMPPREAVFTLHDRGPEAGEQRFEAVLAIDHAITESGPSPSTALRRLVTANPEALEWALSQGNRPTDAMLVLGAWELLPGGERVELVCMVVREVHRVAPDDEPLTIEPPELPGEVHDFAAWALQQWANARGVQP